MEKEKERIRRQNFLKTACQNCKKCARSSKCVNNICGNCCNDKKCKYHSEQHIKQSPMCTKCKQSKNRKCIKHMCGRCCEDLQCKKINHVRITQFGNIDASSLFDRSVALISLRSNAGALSLCSISGADVTM